MKNDTDTELDSLLEEYQNLIDPKKKDFSIMKEEAIFLAMSDKYGRKPQDRDAVIKALKENIERKQG